MKVIIVGGVAAGMSAASKIIRDVKDVELIVFEKTNEVSYGACGLPYYISGVNEDEDLLRIRKSKEFIASGIDLRLNTELVEIDFDNKKVRVNDIENNKEYVEDYDKLIIGTGASPIVPPFEGKDLENVFTLKTIEDSNKIKDATKNLENIVIIGAGYIGMELVETFKLMNKNVRIIEMMDRILPAFDQEITDVIHDYLVKEGVEINVSEGVTKLVGENGKVSGVVTDKTQYPADAVIISVGVRPNTSFAKDKLEMLANGAIVVNKKMETNIKDVYAAGDCATVHHKVLNKNAYIPLGTNANKQGKLIGELLSGKEIDFKGVLGTAFAKIMDIEVGSTGITEKQAIEENIDYKTVFISAPSHAPYYPTPTDIGVKLIYDKNKVILGAQLVGKQGVPLRTSVLATCIWNEMTTDEVSYLDLGYAPPYSHVWDVINIAGSVAK